MTITLVGKEGVIRGASELQYLHPVENTVGEKRKRADNGDGGSQEKDCQQQTKRQTLSSTLKSSSSSSQSVFRSYYALRKGRYHKNCIFFDKEELACEVDGFESAEYNSFLSLHQVCFFFLKSPPNILLFLHVNTKTDRSFIINNS